MSSPADRPSSGLVLFLAAAFLIAIPLTVLALSGGAGSPVRSPHGSLKEPCQTCHSAGGWKPARPGRRFDHARYGFVLAGAHAAAPCGACHRSLVFSSAQKLCASCHEDPHQSELGTDCSRCHTARSFIDRTAMVRGHQLTRLPLTGGHVGLECESCHAPAAQGHLRFVGTPGECEACHMAAYRAARQPDHAAAGFPTDCRRCHSPRAWTTNAFNHDATRFPLTGAHRGLACASCHGGGVYAGKDPNCVACHRANYDATTNPNHAVLGFSTACATCHSTTSWSGAQFDHDTRFFPIYSGGHATRWSACSDCHTSPSNFTVFTCFTCHPHSDQAKTDGNHASVSGYSYQSSACYSCHPRGRK